jgi:hypothetical protein
MSIYPEILKRVIANNLNTTFSVNPNKPSVLFDSPVEISQEVQEWNILYRAIRDTQLRQVRSEGQTNDLGNLPAQHTCLDYPGMVYHRRIMPYDEPIVYILLWMYLQKMTKIIAKNTDDSDTLQEKCATKFRILPEIHENAYITKSIRQNILSIIQKTQRTYHAFSRLSRIYRHKQTPVQINTDLYMNDLTPSHKNTFVLLDHDKIYYFSLNDLAKIILDALTYSYLFFPEPKVCKNPYNNIPFTKSTMYNIYFQMKTYFCVVPRLIQLCFEADFNIYLFKKLNESVILEHIIREYVSKTEPIRMRPDILKMIREYDGEKVLMIHPGFPSKSLLNGFNQMYILYLTRKHTPDGKIYENYGSELTYRMNKFIKQNPQFGRKTFTKNRFANIITTPNPIIKPVVSEKPFVFGQHSPNSEYPSNAFTFLNTPVTQNTNTGVILSDSGTVLFHTNIVTKQEFQESVAYNRSTDIVKDFLENHQYIESAYNRYLYFGSIYSNETLQPLPPAVSDDESDNYYPDPESETDDDFLLRVQHPRNNNDTNDIYENNTVEETHAAANGLVQLLDASSVRFLLATPRDLGRNNMTVYYYDTINGNADEDDTNEDSESTDSEEEHIARMNLAHDIIIEGDNSSDALSVASSIDPDVEYDENDGYDSV